MASRVGKPRISMRKRNQDSASIEADVRKTELKTAFQVEVLRYVGWGFVVILSAIPIIAMGGLVESLAGKRTELVGFDQLAKSIFQFLGGAGAGGTGVWFLQRKKMARTLRVVEEQDKLLRQRGRGKSG